MPAKTFTKTVIVPQRTADGNILTETGEPDGKPLIAKEVGIFTFRMPTFREQKDIDVRVDRDLTQFANPQMINVATYFRIMACAYFPYQVQQAPEGFSWESMSYEDGRALYEAYVEGEAEVTGAKNSGQ